ncbi:MAG: hypothetical protein FJ225_03280 [Lentisphaerae bacterium]|nr:hypothetical protein [Lentisphaerota bacterium]
MERYYGTNGLENVRPVVLIDEVPWGEIKDDALTNVCAPELGWIEAPLRCALYQWEHFQVDRVIPPVFQVVKQARWLRGFGIEVRDRQIKGDTGAYIASHAYSDQLSTGDDLAKLHPPEVVYDQPSTEAALAVAREVFAGLMGVEVVGWGGLHFSIWDAVARYRGVDNLLLDLAERPDFMHRIARRFMEIGQAQFKQLEEQGFLDARQILVHCTPACSRELPAPDCTGRFRPKDVWGRCAAQIFAAVSPDMHDEFDLAYNQQLFNDCGLLYYGCCEPMDRKIDILRKRFKNLRKISITPWADARRAAEAIGRDYVMAAKPNPAFVATATFNPEPVKQEIARYCEACRACGTTVEFVLKDISTIANNPGNLTRWAETVGATIDKYYA